MSLHSIRVNFKEVFTTNVRNLYINPFWTVRQFLETVKPIISQEFNCQQKHIEIIETGQDLPGIPAEAGLPLVISDIPIRQKWGQNLNIAFYIRRKNHVYPQLENLNNNRYIDPEVNPIITNSTTTNSCPVCLETVSLLNRYRCSHLICTNCYYCCLNNEHIVCPICRSN